MSVDMKHERENRRMLDYIGARLGDKTSAGQCILHIAPGGEIKDIEWRQKERKDDILSSKEET